MNKVEMLACLDKFDAIKEKIKAVDENIYIAIAFTVSSFSDGFKYHVCAIRNNKYVKFAFEEFPDTYLANTKTINDYREVLEMLERETVNE